MAMFDMIASTAEKLFHQVVPSSIPPTEAQQITDSIEKARSELKRAESVFNELTEEAAIDFATYDILAAKARYSYLIKLAKEKNVHL